VSRERESLGKKKVFSLDLKTATESLLRTVFGSEFQTAGTGSLMTTYAWSYVAKIYRVIETKSKRFIHFNKNVYDCQLIHKVYLSDTTVTNIW